MEQARDTAAEWNRWRIKYEAKIALAETPEDAVAAAADALNEAMRIADFVPVIGIGGVFAIPAGDVAGTADVRERLNQ